jgi:hypothetical protein
MQLNTRNLLGAATVCFSATILIGGIIQGQQAKSPADARSWILNETAGCSLQEQIEVDKTRIVNINPAHREAAIQALENKSAVLLSSEKFKELVYGRQPADVPPPNAPGVSGDLSNLRPYLVRAVSASTANRSISVHRCHQDLLVFSGSLGGDGPQKDPVVVFLGSKPRRVFVSYMTAK